MQPSPFLHAKWLALRRRWALATAGAFDPHPPPSDLALSPSAAHAEAFASAPLALAWRRAGGGDARAWQTAARAKLAELAGYRDCFEAPSAVRSAERRLPDGLDLHLHHLRAAAGLDLAAAVVRRAQAGAPRRAMICLQGTNSGQHLSWGEARMPADPIKIANGGDYARQAVAHGFLAVCVEQACFGERAERRIPLKGLGPCGTAFNHGLLVGETLVARRAMDVSLVVSWLLAGGAGVPVDEIHVMGNSAGGTTAIFAAALDERIAGVLAGGCVGYMRETIGARADHSGQNTIPGILNWMEFDDVVALVAPRPFLALAGRSDHIFPFAQGAAAVESAAAVWHAFGASDAVAAVAGPGGHRFYPEIAWPAYLALPGVGVA